MGKRKSDSESLESKKHKAASEAPLDLHTFKAGVPLDLHASKAEAPLDLHASMIEVPSDWQSMINNAVKAIVSIRFSQVSNFDCDTAVQSEATGFVIDSENGYILTNRHVACAGPFMGEAIFHDHEEVNTYPIYRDPIHDFGFLKFNPSDIKYQAVTHIEMQPESAKVGLDIRVVGNDAGEKLSILSGSISRLDRNAPDYGELQYNDFNTFYLQAASSTSGGSSGSPVLNLSGAAVALQAGGHTSAATDFYFPLDRVKRAFSFIKRGIAVPRGTIQVQWLHRPFDEARRLGLLEETEDFVRSLFPKEIGMLVVVCDLNLIMQETVIPEGPSASFLEEGDILISINEIALTKFVPLEQSLDDNIGKLIEVLIQRGGKNMKFSIAVQDLHSITPDRFVNFCGAKFNTLSYQLARQYSLPVRGVFLLANSGTIRLENGPGWIVHALDTVPTPTIEDFINVIKMIPDRERVAVTYYAVSDIHSLCISIVSIDLHWNDFSLRVRDDDSGLWNVTKLGPTLPMKLLKPVTAIFPKLDASLGPSKFLFNSIVKVESYTPLRLDGYPRGIVVVSRNIIPFDLGDVSITVADSVIIPAKVVFLHPTHNICFIRYDPALLGSTEIISAKLSNVKLRQGHQVQLAALNIHQRPVCIQTKVTDISICSVPVNLNPRFRAINFDGITLETPLAQQCASGVLCDSQGSVQGLWVSLLGERNQKGIDHEYYSGVHIDIVRNVYQKLLSGHVPVLRGLAVEVTSISLSQCRQMVLYFNILSQGMSNEWVNRIEEAHSQNPEVFMVTRLEVNSPTSLVLKELDLLLSLDSAPLTELNQLELSEDWSAAHSMTIIRDKMEMTLSVPTSIINDSASHQKIVIFAGALIQEPHRAVLQQSKITPSKVYVTSRSKGSPSYMYEINPTSWITHTLTLDAFIENIRELQDNAYVRLKVLSFDFLPSIISVKIGLHYWPSCVYYQDSSNQMGWSCERLERTKAIGAIDTD